MDDVGEQGRHLLDVLYTATHYFGELVHSHHARRHGGLHLLDDLLDVVAGHGCLVGQPADFGGHHGEAPPYSPAFSASIAALRDNRFVWSATFAMVVTTWLMLAAFSFSTPNLELIDAAASITWDILSPICETPSWLLASWAVCSARSTASAMVLTSSFEVAEISFEVAPIWIVVAASSLVVAC